MRHEITGGEMAEAQAAILEKLREKAEFRPCRGWCRYRVALQATRHFGAAKRVLAILRRDGVIESYGRGRNLQIRLTQKDPT